jgi:Copper binding proteins, plastocyanin/azurin family
MQERKPRRRPTVPVHEPKETTVKTVVALLAICGLLLTAVPAMAATPTIRGAVGPGDTIGMPVKPKKGGTYRLTIRDSADEHNFRLRGPGVNVATSVGGTGTKTFTVKLRPGKAYSFVCDPHSDEMRGSFTVRR